MTHGCSSNAPSTSHAARSETSAALGQAAESTGLAAIPAGGLASRNGSPSASAPERGNGIVVGPSDLWSKAYREAVRSMGPEVDVTILQGENIAQLFKELEKADKGAADESAFLRGVRCLNTIQVPLERFKLALDLAAPLATVQTTTSGAFGLIRGVTAVSSIAAKLSLQGHWKLTGTNEGSHQHFYCRSGICEERWANAGAYFVY